MSDDDERAGGRPPAAVAGDDGRRQDGVAIARCAVAGCGRQIWKMTVGWAHSAFDEPEDGHEAQIR